MLEKYKVESDQKTLYCSQLNEAHKILDVIGNGCIKKLTNVEYAYPLEQKIAVACWVPIQILSI
jgi:hypothetical protein